MNDMKAPMYTERLAVNDLGFFWQKISPPEASDLPGEARHPYPILPRGPSPICARCSMT